MRDLAELVDVPEPAWPWLTADLDCSFAHYTVLRPDPDRCQATLHQLQVTASWLRIYGGSGGGPTGLPSMAEVNGFPAAVEPGWQPAAGLIIAHDVLGGVFTVNGIEAEQHGRPGRPGSVVYFSPNTLTWEDLEIGHTQWLSWIVEDAASHYRDLLWPAWRAEVAELSLRDGISVFPFLWSQEAQQDMAATTRSPIPIEQLLDMHAASCAQFGLDDSGELGFVNT
jgi:Protein of unknown function DUF2625